MGELDGRSAIVTGAGSGIGRAIAIAIGAAGAHVGVNDVRGEPAGETVASIVSAGGAAEVLAYDVTDSAAVDAAVDDFAGHHRRLDVLVNNAGAGNPYKPGQLERVQEVARRRAAGERAGSYSITVALTDDEWHRVLSVLLSATFYGTRAALRHMEPAGRGAIVNIASTAGIMPAPLAPEYGAAKAGVIGFTRSVAHEVAGSGVRVNAVAPGTIDTTLNERFGPLRAGLATRQASGRLGRPEEIAEAVLFLVSDRASFCFGEIFTVSGGLA